jgi:hypothetical protein
MVDNDALHRLDSDLAAGRISIDEFRKRRAELADGPAEEQPADHPPADADPDEADAATQTRPAGLPQGGVPWPPPPPGPWQPWGPVPGAPPGAAQGPVPAAPPPPGATPWPIPPPFGPEGPPSWAQYPAQMPARFTEPNEPLTGPHRPRRRTPLIIAAVVVLVAAGVVAGLLAGPLRSKHHAASPPPSTPTLPSTSPSTSPTTPSSTAPPPGPPGVFGAIPGTTTVAGETGSGTLRQAQTRNVAYPFEIAQLGHCGATKGATELRIAAEWSLSGTVFSCHSAGGAGAVLTALTTWEHSRGLATVTSPVAGALVFYTDQHPPTPSHPAQFHVRYTSGTRVIGMVIQATSRETGQAAVAEMLGAAIRTYPPDR